MKKTELEIFKEIEEVEVAPDNEGEPLNSVKEILPYFCEKVEKALKRLDSIENSEPNEALECLERIDNYVDKDYDYCQRGDYDKDYNIIKNCILKAQEQEKDNAYFEKIKTMMKQKDCVLRYIESEDCFAVKTILSDGWYKLTPAFVDDNVREEIKPLPIIEKIKQLKKENIELRQKAQEPKHLVWEDLEKDRTYKVSLNGSQYELIKRYDDYEYHRDYITLQKKPNVSIFIYEYEKEIFNDLRLERVEE